MKVSFLTAPACVLSLAVGCGSSFSAAGDAGMGDASAGDAGSSSEAGGDAGDAGTVGDSSGGGDAATCPEEAGKYNVVAAGAGCGDFPPAATACITQTACEITVAPTGGAKGVSGMAALAGDGSFSDATLMEGSTSRTGCVGSWDPTTSRLTVDCGGIGTTQSCHATLTRTAATCD